MAAGMTGCCTAAAPTSRRADESSSTCLSVRNPKDVILYAIKRRPEAEHAAQTLQYDLRDKYSLCDLVDR